MIWRDQFLIGSVPTKGAWMNDTTCKKYFQFPLKALRLAGKPIDTVADDDGRRIIGNIIDYSVWQVGSDYWNADSKQAEILANEHASTNPDDVEMDSENAVIVLAGAQVLGVQWSNGLQEQFIPGIQKNHETITKIPGGNTLVRIRADLLWSAKDHWNWREFTTLAAVYAGIGRNEMKRLTFDRIGAMAMGFSGQRERDGFNAKAMQLTDRRTKTTVEKLERRKLFVRASANGRHVFYSHRMKLDDMLTRLAARSPKAYPSMKDRQIRIKEIAESRGIRIANTG